jgi:hypothetical protein
MMTLYITAKFQNELKNFHHTGFLQGNTRSSTERFFLDCWKSSTLKPPPNAYTQCSNSPSTRNRSALSNARSNTCPAAASPPPPPYPCHTFPCTPLPLPCHPRNAPRSLPQLDLLQPNLRPAPLPCITDRSSPRKYSLRAIINIQHTPVLLGNAPPPTSTHV